MTTDITADVVVVGGGTAGCVVASRLAGEHGLRVVLIERGPLSPWQPPVDPFPDIAGGIAVEGVDVVSGNGTGIGSMISASRLGGGSAVNGLIAEPPPPADFDRWHAVHGCSDWSWAEVAADANQIARTIPSMPAPEGAVGRALASAVSGARPADVALTVDGPGSLRRVSCVDRLGAPLAAGALSVLGATATSLEAGGGRVTVVTDKGPVRGRDVVLCAGALRTPGLIAAAGRNQTGLGHGLMNHLGVMLPIDRGSAGSAGSGRGTPPVSTVVDVFDDAGDRFGQVIAFEHIDATHRWAGLAAVLLRTVSRGRVTTGSPPVTARMEIDDTDVRALAAVLRRAADALGAMEHAGADLPGRIDLGADRTVGSLRTASEAELGDWIRRHVWHLSHAVGTCAMGGAGSGSIVDDRGRVRGHDSLWVADASVMPEIVGVHPNTTVAVVAHRIAGFVAEGRA